MQSSEKPASGRFSAAEFRELERLSGRYQALLDLLHLPCAVLSTDGRIVSMNDKLAGLLHRRGLEDGGAAVEGYLAPVSQTIWQSGLVSAAATGFADVLQDLRLRNGMLFCRAVTLSVLKGRSDATPLLLAQFEPDLPATMMMSGPGADASMPLVSVRSRSASPLARFPDSVFAYDDRSGTGAIARTLSCSVGGEINLAELEYTLARATSGEVETLYVPEGPAGTANSLLSGRKVTELRIIAPEGEQNDRCEPGLVFVRRHVDCPAETKENRVNAYRDPLTGLANRRAFLKSLKRALVAVADPGHPGLAIFYIDLNEFKRVNDLGGHHTGDDMLWRVSTGLALTLGDRATTARMGGDEFAGLVEVASSEEALQVGERIKDALSRVRLAVKDRVFTISGSIGVTYIEGGTHPGNAEAEDVLAQTDVVCLSQKRLGDQSVGLGFLKPGNSALNHMAMTARPGPEEFEPAEFQTHAEPIRCLDDKRVLGCDIQPAWCGTGGHFGENVWRPAAERAGFLAQIDSWAVETVLAAARSSPDEDRTFVVRISISSVCDAGFWDALKFSLSESSGAAQRICFKVTEGDVLREPAVAEAFFKTAREFGCQTGVDDFAGHWPVLSRIAQLRLDWVMLDAPLVQEALTSPLKADILKGLVGTTAELGINVVAKDVRTKAQAAMMSEMNVVAAQGEFAGGKQLLSPDKPAARI